MAKDDYDVIVFKILTYLYACVKRKTVFEEAAFYHAIGEIEKSYLIDILYMMKNEGFIEGVAVQKVWGTEKSIH